MQPQVPLAEEQHLPLTPDLARDRLESPVHCPDTTSGPEIHVHVIQYYNLSGDTACSEETSGCPETLTIVRGTYRLSRYCTLLHGLPWPPKSGRDTERRVLGDGLLAALPHGGQR